MKNILLALIPVSLAFVVSAQDRPLDTAVATELIRGATTSLAANALQSNPDFARLYNASVLEQELAQEASRRGLGERLDVQRALTISRYQILIQALQAETTRSVKPPTDIEIKAHYEKNKAEINLKEAVRAEVYVLDGTHTAAVDVARAAVAAQKIDATELQKIRFRQVSKAEDMWVTKENFPEEIYKELITLSPGKVRFFKDGENYLLVRYEEQRPERPATLDEAKEDIRRLLTAEKQQAAWNAYVETTRKRLGVTQ